MKQRSFFIEKEKLEADASRNSRESLTPPCLKAAYKISHDNDEDSGDYCNDADI